MSIKLRDLIRSVRACKTAAEERAVIAKESALIRTAFKEQDKQYRHRNVAKLLYIHMLGYPSHFGQMECVKLIASPYFAEKRMGYLGLILLLTDQEEVLTLVTNSMKNDLGNPNPFIVGLSLTAIGNIASPDMARDLAMDVDRHMRGESDYLRKKAALAAVRIFTKVPELVEDFYDSIEGMLRNRNHGVLLSGVQLITEVVLLDEANASHFQDLVPNLVRELRSLLSLGYSSEYDVSGIADPFLQVAILNLLRILGKNNDDASEAMNDVLAQVATNTETAKTAGNAILYECVQTIMSIESDSGLKVLAVNILGRFLLNRDNNIRYVALNTLSKVVTDDAAAVQRHTNTIVDCLKDPDMSIRQRALELIYALVNETNIQTLAREMLNYLVVAPNDQKATLCSRIADAVEKYAPSCRWQIDTLITMLSIAGSTLVDERINSSLIVLIQRNPDLHPYVVHKLYWALVDDISQLSLVHVGIWCVGEYGKMLLQAPPASEDTLAAKTSVDESSIVELFRKILKHHSITDVTRSYSMNALVKLTTRFQNPEQVHRLNEMIGAFNSSMVVELQQRSVEYLTLGAPQWNGLRQDILAVMPPIDPTKVRTRNSRVASILNGIDPLDDDSSSTPRVNITPGEPSKPAAPAPNLLDLDDIFGNASSAPPAPASVAASSAPTTTTVDLLADIFSGTPSQSIAAASSTLPVTPAALAAAPSLPSGGTNDLLGLMDFGGQQAEPANPKIRGYEKNGLAIDMEITKPNRQDPSITYVLASFSNTNSVPLQQFLFQAAFPKYITLKMEPPSANVIPADNTSIVTQVVKIKNSLHGQKPVLMRIKIEYVENGNKVEDMVAVSSFPPNI